jgi:hypothetical protein
VRRVGRSNYQIRACQPIDSGDRIEKIKGANSENPFFFGVLQEIGKVFGIKKTVSRLGSRRN